MFYDVQLFQQTPAALEWLDSPPKRRERLPGTTPIIFRIEAVSNTEAASIARRLARSHYALHFNFHRSFTE